MQMASISRDKCSSGLIHLIFSKIQCWTMLAAVGLVLFLCSFEISCAKDQGVVRGVSTNEVEYDCTKLFNFIEGSENPLNLDFAKLKSAGKRVDFKGHPSLTEYYSFSDKGYRVIFLKNSDYILHPEEPEIIPIEETYFDGGVPKEFQKANDLYSFFGIKGMRSDASKIAMECRPLSLLANIEKNQVVRLRFSSGGTNAGATNKDITYNCLKVMRPDNEPGSPTPIDLAILKEKGKRISWRMLHGFADDVYFYDDHSMQVLFFKVEAPQSDDLYEQIRPFYATFSESGIAQEFRDKRHFLDYFEITGLPRNASKILLDCEAVSLAVKLDGDRVVGATLDIEVGY